MFGFANEFYKNPEWFGKFKSAYNNEELEGNIYDWLDAKLIQITKSYCPERIFVQSLTIDENEESENYYNWEGIPDNELEGYANINHIPVPTPYDRTQIINNILAWKKSKYKN